MSKLLENLENLFKIQEHSNNLECISNEELYKLILVLFKKDILKWKKWTYKNNYTIQLCDLKKDDMWFIQIYLVFDGKNHNYNFYYRKNNNEYFHTEKITFIDRKD